MLVAALGPVLVMRRRMMVGNFARRSREMSMVGSRRQPGECRIMNWAGRAKCRRFHHESECHGKCGGCETACNAGDHDHDNICAGLFRRAGAVQF